MLIFVLARGRRPVVDSAVEGRLSEFVVYAPSPPASRRRADGSVSSTAAQELETAIERMQRRTGGFKKCTTPPRNLGEEALAQAKLQPNVI